MNMKNILSTSLLVTSLYGFEEIQNTIDYNNNEILNVLFASEGEILGYQLDNVEGKINKDLKIFIVKVGKEIEYILPKGVRMKGDEKNLKLFYQVKF